jgi:alpha-tubulin suppressor-like RCC1 family protein
VATLLSVLQDACDFGGFPRPTSIINNTDATTRQLLAIANERGIEAVRMFDWPQLTKLSSLSLVAGTNQTLPADCAELLDSTAWYTGDMTPIRGPITPREWQALTQTGNAGIKFAFRVSQNSKGARAVAMHPTPVGNETISLFYRSKTWIKPREWEASMSVTAGMWVFSDGEYWTANTSGTAGSSAPTIANNGADGTITWTRKANVLYERFIADTDEPLIEPSILMKGILARFYRMKGLEYQDLEAEFNIGLRNDLAERNGGRTSNIFRYNCGFLDTGCRDVGFIGGVSSTPVTPVVPTVPTTLIPFGLGNNGATEIAPGGGYISQPASFSAVNEWANVFAGHRITFLLKTNKTLWAMGSQQYSMGDGSSTSWPAQGTPIHPPIAIEAGSTWKHVNHWAWFGDNFAHAIKENGTLWGAGWVAGNLNNLWAGTSTATPWYFAQIGTATNWKSVSTTNWTVALKDDGTMYHWGYPPAGLSGWLGAITQVGTETNWKKAISGIYHIIALKTDGTLWGWGNGDYGQLTGTSNSYGATPTQIGTGNTWVDIHAGNNFTIAIKSDGTMWGCGINQQGQCGAGQGVGTSGPSGNLIVTSLTQIGTATDWASLGDCHGTTGTLAIKKDGSIWGWGNNNDYQLGLQNGTNANVFLPKLLSPVKPVIQASMGIYHSMWLWDSGA